MDTSVITIDSVTKSYGDVLAVDNLSLNVEKGEIYGFLGPNGAGKTTTIRTILNFITPSKGKISVFGLDSVNDSVKIKKILGYLAGDIALFENMKGVDLLQYMTKLGKDSDWNYIEELVERFEAVLDRKIGTLSKGNKQKLGLIQALMHKPDLIILDEPTSGLDPLMKKVFYELIMEIKDTGRTVFFSSHDLTEVQKICDRAGFVKNGKLIAVETINQSLELNVRRYSVRFSNPANIDILTEIPNITDTEVEDTTMSFTIMGEVGPVLKALAAHNPVDLTEEETNLEDIFMRYYD